jgi:hypothetical protein
MYDSRTEIIGLVHAAINITRCPEATIISASREQNNYAAPETHQLQPDRDLSPVSSSTRSQSRRQFVFIKMHVRLDEMHSLDA